MSTKDLFDRIARLPEEPTDVPHAPPPELVAFVVRWNRGLRQWKVGTLADFARVSVSTVERVERGEKVSDEALDRIAEGLGYEPGYFTKPRVRLAQDEAQAKVTNDYGHLEAVVVSPMKTHRAVRAAAQCDGILIHRPDVPDTYDAEIENLQEWLDLASFVVSTSDERMPPAERGKRDLYNDILGCVSELERRGLTVLSGVMNAPQEGLPDWKIGIVSVTPKLTDPGASKRRHVMVDRRVVTCRRSGPLCDGPAATPRQYGKHVDDRAGAFST